MGGHPFDDGDLSAVEVGVARLACQIPCSPERPIGKEGGQFVAEPKGPQVLAVPQAAIQRAGSLGEPLCRAALAEHGGEPAQILFEVSPREDVTVRRGAVFLANASSVEDVRHQVARRV